MQVLRRSVPEGEERNRQSLGCGKMGLKLFLSSTLRKYVPGYQNLEGINLKVDGEITVRELCRQMNIPGEEIKMVMVNGRSEPLDHLLMGDERVALFPALGGG